MRVLIINEANFGGGAAIAAIRSSEALKKYTDNEVLFKCKRTISGTSENAFKISKVSAFLNKSIKYLERRILNRVKADSHDLLNLDLFNYLDISGTILKQIDEIEPDIINLHWVNNGFLSVKQIETIAKKYKILWTLHDMWPFLGIEHYEREMFQNVERSPVFKFINSLALSQKKKLIKNPNIHFACISNWIKDELQKRWDINEERVHIIQNTYSEMINEITFEESRIEQEKDRFVLILSSRASDTNYRKGFDLLKKVLLQVNSEDVELKVLGCKQHEEYNIGKVKVTEYPSTNDEVEIINHYKGSDLHICCSRMDNFPNTILEANGLFIPTIAFDVGGVSDMIEHGRTGFLIAPFDTLAMARTIQRFISDENLKGEISKALESKKGKNSNAVIAASFDGIIRRVMEHDVVK